MTRKNTCCWFLVLVMVGAGLCRLPSRRQSANRPDHGSGQAPVAAAVVSDIQVAAAVATPEEPVADPSPGKRTAFELVLDGDSVKLLRTDELQGDFHRRRGQLAWWPGMLYFRLLDTQQRVVAEETMAAPERTCAVIAAATPGTAPTPPPAAMASAHVPGVLQVRLPSVASATQLQVYRITGERPADTNAELPAKLLETLTIQR